MSEPSRYMPEAEPLDRLEGIDRDQVRELMHRCNGAEGLRLKLNLEPLPHFGGAHGAFVVRAQKAIVGYCALYPGEPAEFSGMVHPDHRQQGIGSALLGAVRGELRLRGVPGQLICEDGSASGQAFIAPLVLPLDQKEYLMELGTLAALPPRPPQLVMQRAGSGDISAVAGVLAAAFGDDLAEVERFVAHEIPLGGQETHLAWLEGVAVGTLKAIDLGDGLVGMYAVAVLPALQGQGIGRAMLTWLIQKLQADGWRRITIEVDVDNHTAHSLYRSLGFHDATTYGYYHVVG